MEGDQCQYRGGGGLSVREEWEGERHLMTSSLLHVLRSQQFGVWDICMQLNTLEYACQKPFALGRQL